MHVCACARVRACVCARVSVHVCGQIAVGGGTGIIFSAFWSLFFLTFSGFEILPFPPDYPHLFSVSGLTILLPLIRFTPFLVTITVVFLYPHYMMYGVWIGGYHDVT